MQIHHSLNVNEACLYPMVCFAYIRTDSYEVFN